MSKSLFLLAALSLSTLTAALAEPAQVLLVRHAERAAEPVGDPALSPAGQLRARALAAALAHAGVTAIITTEFKRSAETAAPSAQALGLAPEVIAARGSDTVAHIAAVAAAVRRHNGVVLVVGHSNTVPAIAAALGAPRLQDFCESSFNHLWVLRPQAQEESAQLLRLRYGAADEVPGAGATANCQ
ncbi:histidine phosphatase family protein [Roseateles oligotrophus]|uniref:Histidine phosphatase family protein n=1 Tax=Roseateles oligotrophus TaxID=1769250 RepID=A0ABT2YLC7_9BURK|nr:histidine phosphatase family protein [Roseateles oligotrophus]MCV2370705.1 histidine phosphatase family protein [Roseateles oligotrophus]